MLKQLPTEEDVRAIVRKHAEADGALIGILQDIQGKYLHIPPSALRIVAAETGRSLVDVYAAATFYNAFSLSPRGRHLVSVCQGTACHVRGAPAVAAEFRKRLGVSPGQTTKDREFTLETVNCLGACALGPVAVIDGHYSPNVRPQVVGDLLEKARNGDGQLDPTRDPRLFPVELACPRCNRSLRDPRHLIDGYPCIQVTMSFGQTHGWLRLSSLYGSYNVESEFEIPNDVVVDLFCPHCCAELKGASTCLECDASLVTLLLRGGGTVQICARRGCRTHLLNLGETPID